MHSIRWLVWPAAFCMDSSSQILKVGSKHTAILLLPFSLFAMVVCNSLLHNFIHFKDEFSVLQDVISTVQGDDRNYPISQGTEKNFSTSGCPPWCKSLFLQQGEPKKDTPPTAQRLYYNRCQTSIHQLVKT